MPVIQKTYEMNASPEEVFDALVNPELIQIWSGDEAQMNGKVGGTFSLWGGQMYGVNLEVVKNKKLVQASAWTSFVFCRAQPWTMKNYMQRYCYTTLNN